MTKLDIDSMGVCSIASEKNPRVQALLTEMANLSEGAESRQYARTVLEADPGNPWALFTLASNAETAAEEVALLKEVVRQGKLKFEPSAYNDLDLEEHSLGWLFSIALGHLEDALDDIGDPEGAQACRSLLEELVQRNPVVAQEGTHPAPGRLM